MTKRFAHKVFYGWWIVTAAFITMFVATGFIFYSYGVFLRPIRKEFGASNFAASMGLPLMNTAMALFSPFLGRVIDAWSIRRIMMLGCCILAAGFFLAARITSMWQFYALIGTLLGLGVVMIGQLASTALVCNWFVKRRGAALGVATTGVSMSGMIMGPATSWLVETHSWRYAFNTFGTLVLIVLLPLVWAIIVTRPSERGLHPDGATGSSSDDDLQWLAAARRHAPTHAEFSTAATLRNVTFWGITLSIGFNFFGMSATLIHMIPHALDLNIAPMQAGYIMTASAGVGVIGKILFGYVADYVDARLGLLFCLAFQGAGTVCLLFAHTAPQLMWVGALFGFGMGGVVPLWGSLVGDYFPHASFGRVMGLMSPCMLPIQASGVPFAAWIHDRTEDYYLAFQIFVTTYAVSALCLVLVRNPLAGPAFARYQARLRSAARAEYNRPMPSRVESAPE